MPPASREVEEKNAISVGSFACVGEQQRESHDMAEGEAVRQELPEGRRRWELHTVVRAARRGVASGAARALSRRREQSEGVTPMGPALGATPAGFA